MSSTPNSFLSFRKRRLPTLALLFPGLLAGLGLAREASAGSGSLDLNDHEIHLTFLFRYLPTQQDLDTIEQTMADTSAVLCDVTDGQLRIGSVKIRANDCEGAGCQTGFDEADIVMSWTDKVGAGQTNPCYGHNAPCIALGKNGVNTSISRHYIENPVAMAHELAHQVLNLHDAYAAYECKTYRVPYANMFTQAQLESGDGTATSLMMAEKYGLAGDLYTELTTPGTLPALGQSVCAASTGCSNEATCEILDDGAAGFPGGYDGEYDGFKNDTNDTIPVCNAFNPDTCAYEWPSTFWWSQYIHGEVLSEWEQIERTFRVLNGGNDFFDNVPAGDPDPGVSDMMQPWCNTPPNIEWAYDVPEQVMLVLDRSYSMAFHDSDAEKCPPGGCKEICANGKDDDLDGVVDEDPAADHCVSSRIDTLKSFSLIWLDLLAASEEQIETGVTSFACANNLDVPLAVPTSASITSTYAPAINTLVANGNTGLVDAMYAADAELDGSSKAIFLVTDGYNSCGDTDVAEAIDTLQENDTRVFALSFGPGFGSAETARIAGGTNGRYLGVGQTNDLGPAMARQWAGFTNAGQLIPQLPYRLNRSSQRVGDPRTADGWIDNALAPNPAPGTEKFEVWAESNTKKLLVLLATDHEDVNTFGLRAKLVGPPGSLPSSYDTTVASPHLKVVKRRGYMLLELKTPNPGKWQIQLTVPGGATPAQQSGYITVLSRSPSATLGTDLSRAVVDAPGQDVVVRAYPRWAAGNVFDAEVEANLVAPDGFVTPMVIDGGDPTSGYQVRVPPWALDMAGVYELRLRVVADPGAARLNEGEWLPDVSMPVKYVRTASESFVVTPSGCVTPNCIQ